jgi:hypothetical protein
MHAVTEATLRIVSTGQSCDNNDNVMTKTNTAQKGGTKGIT